jgi:DNA-binding CsgD family transcriptional regulator/PAS domain-containing protein
MLTDEWSIPDPTVTVSRSTRTRRGGDPGALVPRIYEASMQPDAWPGVLDALAELVEGVAPALFVVDSDDPDAAFQVYRDVDPSWAAAYQAHFRALDLRRQAMQCQSEGTVIAGHQLVPDEVFLRSPFYQEFLRPQGFHHIAVAMAYKRSGRMGVVRVLRREGAAAFGSRELDLLAELQPHFCRAIEIHLALTEARLRAEALAATLSHIAVGFVCVDGRGRLLHANELATRMLAQGRGLVLRGGQLEAEDAADTAALRGLLAQAREPGCGMSRGLRIRRSSGAPDLSVRVVPVAEAGVALGAPRTAAIVYIRDPAQHGRVSESSLRELFRLTPAEARVAVRLVEGWRTKPIARHLGVSEETVRSHRKQIFAKVEVHSQPELSQRVLAFHAPLST